MKPRMRRRIIAAYIGMVMLALLGSFVLGRLLLNLPPWFVALLSGWLIIAGTVGAVLAIRRQKE